jgi:hypothetical protein
MYTCIAYACVHVCVCARAHVCVHACACTSAYVGEFVIDIACIYLMICNDSARVRRYAKNTLGSVLTCIYKGCVSQNTLKIRSDTPGYIDTSDKH